MPAFYTINISRIYMKQIICFPIYIWWGYCGQKSFQSVSTCELGFFSWFCKNHPICLRLKHGIKFERASRAQSQQNMRARQLNREPRARGLALKKGLYITQVYL